MLPGQSLQDIGTTRGLDVRFVEPLMARPPWLCLSLDFLPIFAHVAAVSLDQIGSFSDVSMACSDMQRRLSRLRASSSRPQRRSAGAVAIHAGPA